MKSEADVRRLNALVDDELGLDARLALEAQLAADPALRARAASLKALREAVREGADYHRAPVELRARVAALAAARPAPAPAAAAPLRRWFAWRGLALSGGLLGAALLALNLAWLPAAQEDRLREEVVASHVRATLGQHLVDVASSDHHTVKPWLSARLGFSPPVPELAGTGTEFLGGRIDALDGQPVAALVYQHGAHRVDSFAWPATGHPTDPRIQTVRGFQTAHWQRDGMTHWVISDLGRDEFSALVAAIVAAERSP